MSRAVLITGGSRGIGAEAALAFARRGFDVVLTYRNKAQRAVEVAQRVEALGVRCLAVPCDITVREDLYRLGAEVARWTEHLDALVLNASGGLERDLVAADPTYPWRINRDAQVAVLESIAPSMPPGSTVVFVTSHWAHLHGQVEQLPAYEPIAASKRAGEDALRLRQEDLARKGIRLIVVTGDLIAGTITPKLLERAGPGMMEQRRTALGELPTAAEMGEAIASAAVSDELCSGDSVVVGGSLESLG